MKVLVIGSGGREHALAQTFHRQGHQVYCFPGNAGTAMICEPSACPSQDLEGYAQFARDHSIDLTVVGSEDFLAKGIADFFTKQGLRLFGPTQKAAILETSKVYSKQFMERYQIPTAWFTICRNSHEARDMVKKYFDVWNGLVIKPSGLTAGKGVICCRTPAEAENAIATIMDEGKFGSAGNEIVIEELLPGRELSLLAFCDGNTIIPMIPSQDHKRLYDNDLGPNTGGIGAYAPVPFASDALMQEIQSAIVERTLFGLKQENISFKGILYFGLMLTKDGPKVLEYNCRFGDPETQAILPLLESDLAEIMIASCEGRLHEQKIKWQSKSACCVVMVSHGYPGNFTTGHKIKNANFNAHANLILFHAGTKHAPEGIIQTAGGRVLGVTGIGATLEEAVGHAYAGVKSVHFDGAHYRNDIALQALKEED